MKHVIVDATTLSDAWFQTVYKCLEFGKEHKIDSGSYERQKRLEFDWITVNIYLPWSEPLLPKLPSHYNLPDPVDEDYLNGYVQYLMTGEMKPGESYTYGQRLCEYIINPGWLHDYDSPYYKNILIQESDLWMNNNIIIEKEDHGWFVNQIELCIWTYKNKGFRNNQMVLQVAKPDDILLQDPPCLRHIDTRIQDNKLHFFPYFRSWDLWGGFPANLAAIEMLKQYMAAEIGVENGEIIATSKGLHLYDHVWRLAEIIRGKTVEEFKNDFIW